MLGDAAELRQERRRERIAGLPAQIDDTHRRHRRSEPRAELQPLELLPALRPGCGAPVHGDRALERSPLRGDRPRVIARIRLLLVGRIVLLVDADDAEPRQGREDGRARADDDRRLAGDDALALVAPLGVGQRRVEYGDAVAEALTEAAERLWREGDLRDEDDRAEPTLERGGAGPEVDLGLAAPGRAGEQEVAAVAVERSHNALERPLLGLCQSGRPRLGREPDVRLPPLTAPRAELRRDELEGAGRRRAVVVGHPECKLDERRRQPVQDAFDRCDGDARGRLDARLDDDATLCGSAEADGYHSALPHVVCDLVRERACHGARRYERVDGCQPHSARLVRHPARLPPWPGTPSTSISRRSTSSRSRSASTSRIRAARPRSPRASPTCSASPARPPARC